jgi:DNA helicase-2/ATP-dependent DNA helicase PcrA
MTRARRQLHLYVPVRYYHRPHGVDDAHGYGKPSRFLTDDVQACCDVVRPSEAPYALDSAIGRRRIQVSVDALFE